MFVLSSGLLLSLLLPFQDGGAGPIARKNAAAARAITTEFGLDRWAGKLIERSLGEARSADDKSELLLARCDVLRLTANRRVNDKDRLPALGEAGKAYVVFLASSPGADRVTKAQANLGILAYQYGETLVRMIETDAIGRDRDAAVATAETIFKSSLKGMNAVIDWWQALPAANPQKNLTQFSLYYPTVFNRALVYLFWAQLYPVDSLEREQRAKQAIEYLEEFAIGAPFLPSQRAYKALADCYRALGQLEDSFDYYEYVSISVKDLLNQETNLDPAFAVQLLDAVQEADYGMLKMLRESGQIGRFWETYDTFTFWVEEDRVGLSRNGYELLLVVAAQMVDEGRIAEAIALADEVAKDNSRSTLRLRANTVMGKAIALAPPDAVIPLDVLYGSAEGAYYQKDYAAAVDGFRLLIPRLAGSRQADEFGARSYYFLGISWSRLHYPMLAAVAHQIGYQDFPDDEDYAAKNVLKWQTLASGFFARNNTDRDLQAFNDAAIEAVNALDLGGDDLEWKQAATLNKLARQASSRNPKAAPGSNEAQSIVNGYKRAIGAYSKVKSDSSNYEKAMVAIAICEYESIRFDPAAADRALAALSIYLDDYLVDPANAPKDPRERKIRREKEPEAVFYLGRTWREKGKAGDASAWQMVLDTFNGMLDRFPDQTELGFAGMSYRVESFVRMDSIEEAEAEYQAMLAVPAIKSRLAIASFTLYLHFKARSDAVEEIEETLAMRRKQAEYLSSYNDFSTVKRWSNLLGEADLWVLLGEYQESAALYQTVLDKFSKEKNFTEAFSFKTKIGLVDSLLQLRRIGEAMPLVDELYAKRPKNLRVRTAVVRVKAGFLVWDGKQVLEVPGEGTTEALDLATTMATELINVAKFEAAAMDPPLNHYFYAPWWEAKLNQGYVYYQRGKTNPADLGRHKKLVLSLQKQDPSLGENVAGLRMSKSLLWLLSH